MSSFLEIAFAHHAWANDQIIDACAQLPADDLDFEAPGTRGSILSTLRHVIVGDCFDLLLLTEDPLFDVDEEDVSLDGLRDVSAMSAAGWGRVLALDLDADDIVLEVDPNDGFERVASVAFRFAEVLHHGTDHRSQLCTALTLLGVTPPGIDVWNFGVAIGQVTERMPDD